MIFQILCIGFTILKEEQLPRDRDEDSCRGRRCQQAKFLFKKVLRSFPIHYGNRTHRQLAAQGMKKSGKRCKSQLAIGRKPLAEDGQEVALSDTSEYTRGRLSSFFCFPEEDIRHGVNLCLGVRHAVQFVEQGWCEVSNQG